MNTQAILTKDLIKDKIICRFFGVIAFTVFTSLGAFVRIPIPYNPVPITLQTFFVILAGLILGGGLGSLSQIFYIILGVTGFSIFTNAGFGLSYLFGPTGGYLFGFVFVALLLGNIAKKISNNTALLFVIVSSSMAILFFGAAWLMLLFRISFGKAFLIGILPFIPGDIIKSIFAYLIFKKIQTRTREIF